MASDDSKGPSKRIRAATACQECRSRKLACDGLKPCSRCFQERRECNKVETTGRSPLTRKRTTELEGRIAGQERLWDAIFPLFSLEAALGRLSAEGLNVTVQEILGRHGQAPAPLHTIPHIGVAPLSERPGGSYPTTRPSSPQQELSLHNALVLENIAQNPSNGWHEGHTPDNQVAGPLDGMGSTVPFDVGCESGGGAGYIGLSSGATLLQVIRRLLPPDIVPTPFTSWNAFGLMDAHNLLSPRRSMSGARNDASPVLQSGVWRRLPAATEFGPLVDAYFRYFHHLTPIVHEPTVRAQLMGALPLPPNGGSRVLLFMIFAMGSFDLALKTEDDNGYKYYQVARHAYRDEVMEEGSIQLVQGLAIMANYLQRCNKPNAGYVCLGVAIRMGIALGIQAPTGGENFSALEAETRTRLWWGLVTLEAGCCSTFGRPHALGFSSLLAVRLPTNCDDESLTVSDDMVPPNAQHVTLYTALIIQARLTKTVFNLQDRLSRSLPSPTVEQIRWCGQAFQETLSSFPAFMQTPASGPYRLARSVQNWRARDLMSVIYRPVLLSAAWSPDWRNGQDRVVREIIETCRSSALENLRDIGDFCRSEADPHRGAEWYILYFGFQASLTLLLFIVWEPGHVSSDVWRGAITEALQWFRQLDSVGQLAASYATIMENVLNAKHGSTFMNQPSRSKPDQSIVQGQTSTPGEVDQVAFDFERYLLEIRGLQAVETDAQLFGNVAYASDGFGELDQVWDFGS